MAKCFILRHFSRKTEDNWETYQESWKLYIVQAISCLGVYSKRIMWNRRYDTAARMLLTALSEYIYLETSEISFNRSLRLRWSFRIDL